MGFIWFVIYVLFGAFLLGISLKLYTKPKVQGICEMLGVDEILDSYGDSFIGLCAFYALLWPLVIATVIFIVPFAVIKYLYDNKWSKEEENNEKESLDI